MSEIIAVGLDLANDQQLPSEFAEIFDLMVASASEGLWAWDIKGNRLYWSASLLRLLVLDKTAVSRELGDFFQVVHPDDADVVRAAMDAHLKDRAPYEIEFRMLHRDGHSVPILSRSQASWDDHSDPVRMVGAVRNLSDQESLVSTLECIERLAHIGHWHVSLDPPKLFRSAETLRVRDINRSPLR